MANNNETHARTADIAAAIDAHGDAVLRFALCRMRNRADAEDVFQTVFLRLFQHAPTFENDTHARAWLLRVTANCCNDLYRDTLRRRQVPIDEASQFEGASGFPNKQTETLQSAIAELPEAYRTALHLHYVEGYKTHEIAAITGEKPGTVRAHLHRARKALKAALEGENDA